MAKVATTTICMIIRTMMSTLTYVLNSLRGGTSFIPTYNNAPVVATTGINLSKGATIKQEIINNPQTTDVNLPAASCSIPLEDMTGKQVVHEKYGKGIVVEVLGNEITIDFGEEWGIKHLDAEWAPIKFE